MGDTGTGSATRAASSLLIAQLARGTRRRVEQVVAPAGLRPREFLVLQHLRERGPTAQQTLTEPIGVDATNLVAVLNSLEDGGLIERSRDRADRRRAIITLSDSGRELLADTDRALCRIDDEILASLSPDERDTLNALLAKAMTNMGTGCIRPSGEEC
jgi:DNA-binding MarR family transcriptional regulator